MSIVISTKPDLSITTTSVSPNGSMLSLTDMITGTPSGFRGDTMPIATCDGMSATNTSEGPGPGASSGSGGSGNSSGSGTQGCPPCWSAWACQDNYQVINYFTGTHNADGSCTLEAQMPNDGTTDITLDCGGANSQMGTWSNDSDVSGAPAIDFVEGALVLRCDQT